MRFITFIILVILSVGSIFAQEQDEIILSKLEIEGNTLTNTDVIAFTSGLKIGSVINAGDFSRAVKQLWQSNLFNDVQIYGTETGADSILITIQVVEAPVLESIKISGNKKIRESKITEAIALRAGQRIPDYLLETGRYSVKKLYEEDGYLLAEVDFKLAAVEVDTSQYNYTRLANSKKLLLQ
jgi:outer membrane protein insertion porin family